MWRNKRGWIRIVEAFVSVLIVVGTVLILMDKGYLEDSDISEKIYEEELRISAIHFEPHKLANYLENLAALFHKFYTECRIIGSDKNLAEARIALIIAVKTVLKNGLTILSIEAPESMY